MSKQFLNKFNVKVLKQKYYFAIIILLHGEIAQLASAIGSYLLCKDQFFYFIKSIFSLFYKGLRGRKFFL